MGQTLTSPDNKLKKFYVPTAVQTSVQIRAYNGSAACLAPIGGIGIYAADPTNRERHRRPQSGRGRRYLADFVRSSNGDPMAGSTPSSRIPRRRESARIW